MSNRSIRVGVATFPSISTLVPSEPFLVVRIFSEIGLNVNEAFSKGFVTTCEQDFSFPTVFMVSERIDVPVVVVIWRDPVGNCSLVATNCNFISLSACAFSRWSLLSLLFWPRVTSILECFITWADIKLFVFCWL